ncbi:hypothetical protein E4U26_006755 [Claviceps purpurea]|nr:hypothetical protein E4U26_006755 [Claviceps purpurea]
MIMQNLRHNLDPEGDTILVLRCPNTQKLVWEPKDAGNKWKRRNYTLRAKLFGSRLMSDMESDHFEDGDTHERSPEPIATTIESSVSSHEVEFRLSSRHLTLASPVFKKMMSGSWKESAPSSDGQVRYELTATEWDANDFLLLMRVIHGRNIQVPLSIDLETLGRISVLVDYYQCEEVTRLAVGLWIDKVGELPTSYGPECVIWMFVSWVFSYSEIFEKMTELAMKGSEGGLGTIYLPFPPTLLSMSTPHLHDFYKLIHFAAGLEQKRDHFLDEMFNTLGGA